MKQVDPIPKKNAVTHLQRALHQIEIAEAKLQALDVLIRLHAAMLDVIQPYAQGKISCRFISLKGGAPAEPTFVSWKRTANGKLDTYDILPSSRVTRYIKRYGPFENTQYDVRFLIGNIKRLVERRKGLTGVLGRFSHAISLSMRAADTACEDLGNGFHEEVLVMHERHRQRVKNWQDEVAAKAWEKAELAANGVIVDPSDYDVFELPPLPDDIDDDNAVLPVDENGDYVEED